MSSTLFENYYDGLGHILYIGSTVKCNTSGHFIFGTVVDIIPKSDNKTMYKVIPNIGCSNALLPKLKKYYIISDKNIFLITVKKKS